MSNFKDMARVSVRGGQAPIPPADDADPSLPNVTDKELPATCWLVHQAALEAAKSTSAPQHLHEGIAGLRWEGHQNNLVYNLWPTMPRDPDHPQAREAKLRINNWLRRSNNMVCLTRGNQREPSTWWVRLIFREDLPPVTPRSELTRAEKKLTPAEAGENRPPAPVESAYTCTWEGCKLPFSSPGARSAHHLAAHRGADSYMLAALTKLGRPGRPQEIHNLAAEMGYPAGIDITRRTLDALWDAQRLLRKEISTPTGPGWAYALSTDLNPAWDQIPDAKIPAVEEKPAGLPCRYQGCPEPPFRTVDQRAQHERREHADQRPIRCEANRSCRERFANLLGYGIHLSKGHGVNKGTGRYATLMEKASSQMAAWEKGVPAVPAAPPAEKPATAAPPPPPAPPAAAPPAEEPAVQAVLKVIQENQALRAENDNLRGRLDTIQRALNPQ